MHHLPSNSRGTRLLLYYVLTWRSVKNLRGKIGENSLVSLSVLGFPLLVGSASRKEWKIFINGVKPLLGYSIPVLDATLGHAYVFFGNVLRSVHLDILSFEQGTMRKMADIGFVTLLFLLEDLILLPSLLSQNLVEDWLQRVSAPAMLMCVGAVVVVLVWSF
jgi:hypothetical protein